jgi:hypothetical protein
VLRDVRGCVGGAIQSSPVVTGFVPSRFPDRSLDRGERASAVPQARRWPWRCARTPMQRTIDKLATANSRPTRAAAATEPAQAAHGAAAASLGRGAAPPRRGGGCTNQRMTGTDHCRRRGRVRRGGTTSGRRPDGSRRGRWVGGGITWGLHQTSCSCGVCVGSLCAILFSCVTR